MRASAFVAAAVVLASGCTVQTAAVNPAPVKPVVSVVYYEAEWCGICRMTTPVIDELYEEYAGRVGFSVVDVGETIPEDLGITGVPTTVVNVFGTEHARFTGHVDMAVLKAVIDGQLWRGERSR